MYQNQLQTKIISGRNDLIIFIKSDERFNAKIVNFDEMMLINFSFPCMTDELKQSHLVFVNDVKK